MKVEVLCGNSRETLYGARGSDLLTLLRANGYLLPAECGGRGTCGKCRVKALYGLAEDHVLACRTVLEGDCGIELPQSALPAKAARGTAETGGETRFGIAVDIGTTTLAFALVGLESGKTLGTATVFNPQRAFGADVLSRIRSADEGHLGELCEGVRGEIARFAALCGKKIERMTVAGNTTMLHLFLNREVRSLGRYPFRPLFTDALFLRGEDAGIPCEELVVLPSADAFVGADVVAGAVALGLGDGCDLLVDMGTNGEMMLCCGGKTVAASTAAGPCFEGANIECGTVAAEGAIDRIFLENGEVRYTVIGGGKPTGICGAALVDSMAVLLDLGVLDGSGRFTAGEDRFYITDTVYVSQADVRAFQLAKSAICAGIKVLLSAADVPYETVGHLYLAGGMGFYLGIGNAARVGLIPKELAPAARAVGNTSLLGAKLCLLSEEKTAAARSLGKRTQVIDLSSSAEFMEEFIACMGFGE